MEEFEDAYFLVACQYCGVECPAIDLDEHEDTCDGFIKYVSSDIRFGNTEATQNQGDVGEQSNEMCICGNSFPVFLMPDHKAVCEVVLENCDYALEVQLKNSIEDRKNAKSALNENEPGKESVEIQKKSSPTISTENMQASSNFGVKENSNKNEFADTQETKNGAKIKITKENKLQESKRGKAEGAKKSKTQNKSGNVFTIEVESSKNFEYAKPAGKTQKYPPIECKDEDDSTDDLKHISDEDCEETLEDFWKRAREMLKRRRTFNAQ